MAISTTVLFQHLKYLLIINLFMSNTFQSIKEQQLGIRVFTVFALKYCFIRTMKIWQNVRFNAQNAAWG